MFCPELTLNSHSKWIDEILSSFETLPYDIQFFSIVKNQKVNDYNRFAEGSNDQ